MNKGKLMSHIETDTIWEHHLITYLYRYCTFYYYVHHLNEEYMHGHSFSTKSIKFCKDIQSIYKEGTILKCPEDFLFNVD